MKTEFKLSSFLKFVLPSKSYRPTDYWGKAVFSMVFHFIVVKDCKLLFWYVAVNVQLIFVNFRSETRFTKKFAERF